MLWRVPSMQERCGATSMPVWAIVVLTVSIVPERVVPPAPKVTEKNDGSSAASGPRATARFSFPAGVLGGNSSTLKSFGCLYWVCMNFPQPPNQTDRPRQSSVGAYYYYYYWPKPGDRSRCIPELSGCLPSQSRLHDTMYG